MKKTVSILVIVIVVAFYQDAISQCIASGLKNGGTFANDASTGSISFSNPSNAQSNDNSYSTATATAVLISLASTRYLKVTNFGFSLPATAIICGIEVSIVKKASGLNISAFVNDNIVKLVKNGTISGSNYASAIHWGNTNTTVVYGNPTDSWGSVWSYSDINAANFGVVFSSNIFGLAGLGTAANIDQVQVNVYYDVTPLPIELESFTAIKNNSSCFVSWVMNADNNFKNFIVQRSANLTNWENLSSIQATKNQRQYLYNDENLSAGNNYYRLQLTDIDGRISYSAISIVSEQYPETVRIYPNPASGNINILINKGAHIISIRDEYGRVVKSLTVNSSGDPILLSVYDLKQGSYFMQIDDAILKLWKK